nr:glycoside hydrolase family 13 protein [Actinomycetota bacterium]
MTKNSWWPNSAIYQVYPRSFQDSNGDGEGDLKGLVTRMGYLKSLGVDAIWLSPFYKSPNKDGGYDVADPRDVDPRFGNLSDAKALIDSAHKVGLRVIVDIVPNHFSTEHQWFKAALNSPKGSPERARFHFYNGRGETGEIPPNNWNSIFGGPAWSRITEKDGTTGQWYLHLFDSTQADLNWNNQEVREDFETTLRFWLDLGADGFRIDVAHGLAKDEILKDHHDPEALTRALRLDVTDMPDSQRAELLSDVPFFDREGVHEIYRGWRKIFDSYPDERISVAEAWVHPSSRAARYVRSDELHQIFNFDFLVAPWSAATLIPAIKRTLSEVATVAAPPTWVLSNHDSPRLVTRLGGGESGELRARAFALLTHALPGGIYIFQGEELGLADGELADEVRQDPIFYRTNGKDKGRDGARIPIPWDSSNNFGFTTGSPWLPIPSHWSSKSVAAQDEVKGSSLNFYRESLRIRSSHPALKKSRDYEIHWLTAPEGVIAFERNPGFALFANTTAETMSLEAPAGFEILFFSRPGVVLNGSRLTLPGDATCWLTATATQD